MPRATSIANRRRLSADGTRVDDVPIMTQGKARYDALSAPSPFSVGYEISTVNELLLEDGSSVFKCVHPNVPNCVFVSKNIRSVTAHQRSHSAKAQLSRTERELRALKLHDANARANRSDSAKRAAATRQANRQANKQATELNPESGFAAAAIPDTLLTAARNVTVAYEAFTTTVMAAQQEFERCLTQYMRAVQSTRYIDSDIVAKAKQYDALRAALNGSLPIK